MKYFKEGVLKYFKISISCSKSDRSPGRRPFRRQGQMEFGHNPSLIYVTLITLLTYTYISSDVRQQLTGTARLKR